ncbi:MAG: hypothetical protein H0T62_10110 [Parachlamydiaceae bacterium]|nr:hypothetical protein [Parachlamydiaceae bacterium]
MSFDVTSTSPAELSYQQNSPVLNRKEAKSKLRKLALGTQEHSKLQDALTRTNGIVQISLPYMTYKVNTSSEDCVLLGGFGSSEHVAIGNKVILNGLAENPVLLLKGVTPVRFGQIVALAGDFYSVYGGAISLPGGSNEEKTERFIKAFETLSQANNDQIRRLLLVIEDECTKMSNSSLPHHCYSHGLLEGNNEVKKIKSDIEDLLYDNSDHFSEDAEEAYRIGHAYATIVAKEAGLKNDFEGLKLAYAMDAFACHFLTDLFAAGHNRNQRGALETFLISKLKSPDAGFNLQDWIVGKVVDVDKLAKKISGLLTFAQHEKDGNEGLNVENGMGEHWRAYGDGCYFNAKNEKNRAQAIKATQESVNEIYSAYANPETHNPSAMEKWLPRATPYNPFPLYSIEEGSMYFYQGIEKIEIKTISDFFNIALSQTVKHLPQVYIDGFLTPSFRERPIVKKFAMHQIQRLTGSIWGMVGLASCHRIMEQKGEFDQKIDEMADTLNATHRNTVQILDGMKDINNQLDRLIEDSQFKDLYAPISIIENKIHQWEVQKKFLSEKEKIQMETDLLDAQGAMSKIFSKGTTLYRQNMLETYQNSLKKTTFEGSSDNKIVLTYWFRQMLDIQIQAFSLYAALQAEREVSTDKIREMKLILENDLSEQITINKVHIDETLIYESQNYINLQILKDKIKKLEICQYLNSSKKGLTL